MIEIEKRNSTSKGRWALKAIYIFYSTTRIGPKYYYLTTGNNSSGKTNTKAEKISKKLRKSAEFGFIFQEILFPV